jgi:opacity protein-like surface antigen
MKLMVAVVGLAASVFSAASHAAWTGRELTAMERAGQQGRFVLGAYAAGIADAEATLRIFNAAVTPQAKRRFACVPVGASPEQMGLVVSKWLRDNPSRWHEQAYFLVREAFVEAWPCEE